MVRVPHRAPVAPPMIDWPTQGFPVGDLAGWTTRSRPCSVNNLVWQVVSSRASSRRSPQNKFG